METQKLSYVRKQSSEILLGNDVLNETVSRLVRFRSGRRCVIVTNEVVARWYLAPLSAELRSRGFKTEEIILPDGEEHKTMQSAMLIIQRMLTFEADRNVPVIALGGGVIGDLTGFAASIFKRGLPFVYLPTSLLAMVDSCVGGKVGVNIPEGKNLIGTFYQPLFSAIDVAVLKTLPLSQLSYGLAEAIKHGVIADAAYYKFILNNGERIRVREPGLMQRLVRRSINIKKSIVEADELDHGKRAILNFGHTFGHALETLGEYRRFHHGEAVGLGMLSAIKASKYLGILKEDFSESLMGLLSDFGLPTSIPREWSITDLAGIIANDKKRRADRVAFALPVSLGNAVLHMIDLKDLEDFLAAAFSP